MYTSSTPSQYDGKPLPFLASLSIQHGPTSVMDYLQEENPTLTVLSPISTSASTEFVYLPAEKSFPPLDEQQQQQEADHGAATAAADNDNWFVEGQYYVETNDQCVYCHGDFSIFLHGLGQHCTLHKVRAFNMDRGFTLYIRTKDEFLDVLLFACCPNIRLERTHGELIAMLNGWMNMGGEMV
jgi:hypothetical protein